MKKEITILLITILLFVIFLNKKDMYDYDFGEQDPIEESISQVSQDELTNSRRVRRNGHKRSSTKDRFTRRNKAFTLIKSDKLSTRVNFTLPEFSVSETKLSNLKTYSIVNAGGESRAMNKKGYPALPVYKQEILVPEDSEPKLLISSYKNREVEIEPPLPGVGAISRQSSIPEPEESTFYKSGRSYPANYIEVKPEFRFRGMKAVTVVISPFIYDSGTKTLKVFDNIDFSIRTPKAKKTIIETPLTNRDFQRAATETFINYTAAESELIRSGDTLPDLDNGYILIITPDKFTESIVDFVDWKRSIGFTVEHAVYPDETGTTIEQLKDFTSAKEENGISHIIIMGEYDDVPSRKFFYDSSSYKWYDEEMYFQEFGNELGHPATNKDYIIYSDLYFAGVSLLENDAVQDIYISRFSVTTPAELEFQLNNAISYERGEFLLENSDLGWINSVLLTASDEGGTGAYLNRTDYEHLDAQEELLRTQSSYNSFFKAYDYPTTLLTAEKVVEALNSGAAITYYLGHGSYYRWSTTRFGKSNLDQINSVMPTVSIQPVCQTGGFFYGSFAESQMASGKFIGVLASTNNTWWNPPMVQIEEFSKNISNDEYQTAGGFVFDSVYQSVSWSAINQGPFVRNCTASQLHYFGDCSLGLRTKTPKLLNLVIGESIANGAEFTVKVTDVSDRAVAGANVTLTTGENSQTGVTNFSGEVTLIAPLENGSYLITAWERNAIVDEKIITIGKLFTLGSSTVDKDSTVLNLEALFSDDVIGVQGDDFYIENGWLKAAKDLDISNGIIIDIVFMTSAGVEQVNSITLVPNDDAINYRFNLVEGWNLIGSPVDSSSAANTIFIDANNTRFVGSNLYSWQGSSGAYSEVSLENSLAEQQGYWVYSDKSSETAQFTGVGTKGVMSDLSAGWNLYSPIIQQPYPAGALAVWLWDVENQEYTVVERDQELEPLKGYWIFMNINQGE